MEKNCNDNILNGNKTLEEHKKTFEKDISTLNKTIERCQQEIAAVQGRIEDCREYLALGKDKISEFCFSGECAAFGVEKSFDTNIKTLRDKALAKVQIENDNYVNITCPACGEVFQESERVIAEKGYAVCKICGNKIQVNGNF